MSKSYIITNTKFGNSSVAIKNFLSSVKQNHYLKTKQSSELIALKQLKKLETAYFVPQH